MIRAFNYPLKPTKAQEETLDAWRMRCCELYNAALQERRDAWQRQRVTVTRYDQQKELTQLRSADPEWGALPVFVLRSAIARVHHAFSGFFARIKTGRKAGYPRFRSHRRYDSFDLGTNMPRVEGSRVHLPKLGAVRFHKYRGMRGVLRHVTVRRKPTGAWVISFVCELGETPAKVAPKTAIGIDVGLSAFATLSNGERIDNPGFFLKGEAILGRRQSALARMRRGSKRRERQRRLVAKAHEHVHQQRLDFARKFACALFSRFDLVCFEKLEISHMTTGTTEAPAFLAKSIYDVAWRMTLDAVTRKAEGAGKWSQDADRRGTSIDCSGCGEAVPKALSQRVHHCYRCGLQLGRDHNAARNILARGLRAANLAEVSEGLRGL